MAKFQIVAPHQPTQCLAAMEELLTHDPEVLDGALAGCPFGDHTLYSVVDAETDEEARNRLPPALRPRTRVAQVEQISANTIAERCRTYHEEPA